MRKPDLINAIAEEAGISKEKANLALNAVLNSITTAMQSAEPVSLIGFGTFQQRHRAARNGKNPQTGQPMHIQASKTVAFKPGKKLKAAVN